MVPPAHLMLAKNTCFQLQIMSSHSFQEVAWCQVYNALHTVLRLFQLWACNQVMEVAGTNLMQTTYKIHTARAALEPSNHAVVSCTAPRQVGLVHYSA